jgi:hypothetical protein
VNLGNSICMGGSAQMVFAVRLTAQRLMPGSPARTSNAPKSLAHYQASQAANPMAPAPNTQINIDQWSPGILSGSGLNAGLRDQHHAVSNMKDAITNSVTMVW